MLRIIYTLLFCLVSLSSQAEAYTPSLIIYEDKLLQGESCAQTLIEHIVKNNEENLPTVLGLATGSTPIPAYKAFIKLVKEYNIDLSTVITFNLDEYLGLPTSHPQSYHSFMYTHLFNELLSPNYHLGIKPENIHIPNGLAKTSSDLSREELTYLKQRFPQSLKCEALSHEEELFILKKRAEDYEGAIKSNGPIDIQILGIGTNGHIGFAEPGSPFDGTTMIVPLSESTRQDNKRFFDSLEDVPKYAMTMGIGTILKAKMILLLATGKAKAPIIEKTLNMMIATEIPATALRTHPHVTFILDQDAAQEISQ